MRATSRELYEMLKDPDTLVEITDSKSTETRDTLIENPARYTR